VEKGPISPQLRHSLTRKFPLNYVTDWREKPVEWLTYSSVTLRYPTIIWNVSGEMFQCTKGHPICGKCHPILKNCPMCKIRLGKIRWLFRWSRRVWIEWVRLSIELGKGLCLSSY
jgi:hypothetical protein